MREQIARTAGFNRVCRDGGREGGREKGGGDNKENATGAREERETEIIVEITYASRKLEETR